MKTCSEVFLSRMVLEFQPGVPAWDCCTRLECPWTWHLPLLTFLRFLPAPVTHSPRSPWTQPCLQPISVLPQSVSFNLLRAPSHHPGLTEVMELIHRPLRDSQLPAALGTAPHHLDLGSPANFPASYQSTCPLRGYKGATGLCQRSHWSHHVQHVHCQLS